MITKFISVATLFAAGSLVAGETPQLGAQPVATTSTLARAGGCGASGCGSKDMKKDEKAKPAKKGKEAKADKKEGADSKEPAK